MAPTTISTEKVVIREMILTVSLHEYDRDFDCFGVRIDIDYRKPNGSVWQVTDLVAEYDTKREAVTEYRDQVLRLRQMSDELNPPKPPKDDWLDQAIRDQQAWIASRGGSRAGYIDYYGAPGMTETWSGDGGIAIYEADLAALRQLEAQRDERDARIRRVG